MKVFVTGTDGYLGCILAEMLHARGHEVTGCDTGYYRSGWLYNGSHYLAQTLSKDIRRCTPEDLEGHDAVIHLAELSNDPVGELSPTITYDINHKGSIHLAQAAKQVGVPRFVYFSSCSVYGEADGFVTEESAVNPLTAYAKCKILVENDLKKMAGDNFCPTYLRNATAYGASPRQRFDIVVNNLAAWAYTARKINMESDGTPWRPLVHANDICKAATCALEAPRDAVFNETFNVGDTKENYQIKDVAKTIADTFPGCELMIGNRGGDRRDYKVNFDKINSKLPGFSCDWTVAKGAAQLLAVFDRIKLDEKLFTSPPHTRLRQIKHLLETSQINQDFFWNPTSFSG